MTSKFRGKYLQVTPLGLASVIFDGSGNKYQWRKVTTTVHNIIVGKLWVDQHGDMDILGKGPVAGVKCHLKYIPYSYFNRDPQRRVKGVVMDANDQVKWILNGTWDDKVEIAPVTGNCNIHTITCSKYIIHMYIYITEQVIRALLKIPSIKRDRQRLHGNVDYHRPIASDITISLCWRRN